MGPSKLRKAIGAVKDQTSIGMVMVAGNSDSASDLEIAIIKATSHDDTPPKDRHVRQIIKLTAFSKPLLCACLAKIGHRLNKTCNWIVALKTLILVHRLLTDGDQRYQEEISFARRHGARFLNMSSFRDASCKSDSWDFSAFVRTYAQFLDEQLEFRMQETRKRNGGQNLCKGDDGDESVQSGANAKEVVVRASPAPAAATPVHEMKNDNIFIRVGRLKQLLQRFLACKPTGDAKRNKVVKVALYPIVKESFQIFHDMTEVIASLIERFMQLEVSDMIKVHDIFSHVSKQYEELDDFYDWCKSVGIMRPSKFPRVDNIPKSKLGTMEDFIHQKTELLRNRTAKEDECVPPVDKFIDGTEKTEKAKPQEIGDLLDLSDDYPSNNNDRGHTMALVLYNSAPPPTATTPTSAITTVTTDWEPFDDSSVNNNYNTKWEAFKDSPGQWETNTANSKRSSSFPFMLDNRSIPSPRGTPGTLALPAPPAAGNGLTPNADPFAASLAIVPYLVPQQQQQQQQQYARPDGGMQGWIGLGSVHQLQYQQYPYQYMAGGYARAW